MILFNIYGIVESIDEIVESEFLHDVLHTIAWFAIYAMTSKGFMWIAGLILVPPASWISALTASTIVVSLANLIIVDHENIHHQDSPPVAGMGLLFGLVGFVGLSLLLTSHPPIWALSDEQQSARIETVNQDIVVTSNDRLDIHPSSPVERPLHGCLVYYRLNDNHIYAVETTVCGGDSWGYDDDAKVSYWNP
jgi:hypothetical protein